MENSFTINSENDILIALNSVRSLAFSLSFSDVEIQKLLVAVSELTHNVLDHAQRNGILICEGLEEKGIKITVKDNGLGIKNVEKILRGETNTVKKGLGLGLAGAKRLMDTFLVETSEKGTTIIAIKWRNR